MIKKARKTALSHLKHHSPSKPLTLKFPVKKTGLYTIRQIIDESKLEVRPKRSEAVVVQCPQAHVLPTKGNKCRNDLSDVGFEVIGTPPLRVEYRKVVGNSVANASFTSIQPDDFSSPLARYQQALATKDELSDASWARPRRIVVPVNETLSNSGTYWYAVDKVQDALGNTVSYKAQNNEDYELGKGKARNTQQLFMVHDRPVVSLRAHGERPSGCDTQHPLKVARGEKEALPIKFSSLSTAPILDTSHTLEYEFTPQVGLLKDGEHNAAVSKRLTHVFKNSDDQFLVGESGLYSLVGVSTPFCEGEVREPASCMLQNPPEPEIDFQKSDIKDKCHENSVGMRLALSLIGSPPFLLHYSQQKKGDRSKSLTHKIDGLRGQIDLQPDDAGDYVWKFTQISDRYYKAVNLPSTTFEMSVKPAASAHFQKKDFSRPLCLNQRASVPVKLVGEGPWNLKYELILPGGRRLKYSEENIENEHFTIETEPLDVGGEYTVSLTSVQAGGCAEDLQAQVAFNVRYQKPRAGFGPVDGKRITHSLEDKQVDLPVRLTGERPWTVHYKNGNGAIEKKELRSENAQLNARFKGEYELLGVEDRECPGEVDLEANAFVVDWIERPGVKIQDEARISSDANGRKFTKEAVCEGYDDSFEVVFNGALTFADDRMKAQTNNESTGNAPYVLSYEEHAKPDGSSKFMRSKKINAALGSASIGLETSKAGFYEYKLIALVDQNYKHEDRHFAPLVVQQRVYPRPSAKFTNPGKTYNFCSVDSKAETGQASSDELIPITLTGVPPFHVEVEVKNLGTAKPSVLTFDNIASHSYNLRPAPSVLRREAVRIPQADQLILALCTDLPPHTLLVRPFRLRFQHLAPLSSRASNISEFEWWRAVKIKN